MKTVISKDGTQIAFEQLGQGPALILVGGALEHRGLDSETAQLAPLLAEHCIVFHYDRRGRGDSTDTPPYAVAREIEDEAGKTPQTRQRRPAQATNLLRAWRITRGAARSTDRGIRRALRKQGRDK